jgi:hypothetical protein
VSTSGTKGAKAPYLLWLVFPSTGLWLVKVTLTFDLRTRADNFTPCIPIHCTPAAPSLVTRVFHRKSSGHDEDGGPNATASAVLG